MKFHQQQHQPMHASMVSLALLLGWLFAGSLFVVPKQVGLQPSIWFTEINFYNLIVDWKLFSIIAFIFGIRAHIFAETGNPTKFFYLRSFAWFCTALFLAVFNAISIIIIPLLVFGVLLFQLRNANQSFPFIMMSVLIFAIMILGWFGNIPNFGIQSFPELSKYQLFKTSFIELVEQFTDTSNLITWLYGCLVMVLGFWVGKGKWLIEYHFRYSELKRLFILSFVLLSLWIGLNYFKIYQVLYSWKGGELFYLADAIAVQLLTLFIYLFLLIHLENYRWGVWIIRSFTKIGKMWLFNVFVLFILVWVATLFDFFLNSYLAVICSLSCFLFFGFISTLMYPWIPESFRQRVY